MLSSLLLVWKLAGQQKDAFSLPSGASGPSLIYLQDLLSSCKFLVDSGASLSVFPSPSLTSGSGVKLVTADSSSLMALSLSQWMRLTSRLFLFCSSSWIGPGRPWLSSQRSCLMLSRSTLPLTGNFLPPTLLYVTSFSCWKLENSLYLRPQTFSLTLFRVSVPGPPASSATCPTWLSSRAL